MERRYALLAKYNARNIKAYNEKIASVPLTKTADAKMRYVVCVVDEFADLMMTSGAELTQLVQRLAQKSRAVGIHLVLATQRPSVKVITGDLKANLPYRIAFKVSSAVDSSTILGKGGAERLLGLGDMLLSTDNGGGDPERVHGVFFSDKAIAIYRDAGLQGIANTLEQFKGIREAANAVIDAPIWNVDARTKLLDLCEKLQSAMNPNLALFDNTMRDFGRIQREGAAILDAASPEAKAAFSPAELEGFRRALAAGGQNHPILLAAKDTMLHFNSREIEPLVNHIVDAAERSARLANSATMTGEAVLVFRGEIEV
jgi:S-DNA-T family DNA segregation ATPase FtsK/SpoIIIE